MYVLIISHRLESYCVKKIAFVMNELKIPIQGSMLRRTENRTNVYFIFVIVQQLLQAIAASTTAAELLWLLASCYVPAMPRHWYALRQTAHLLLHEKGVSAVPAVAITVGGAGNISRHPPIYRRRMESCAVSSSSRYASGSTSGCKHEYGITCSRPSWWFRS